MCSQNNENIILNHSVIKKEKNDVLYVLFSLHTICLYKVFWYVYVYAMTHSLQSRNKHTNFNLKI